MLRGEEPRLYSDDGGDCCYAPDAARDVSTGPYLETTRLTRDTGFRPAFDVATAVADYVAWRPTIRADVYRRTVDRTFYSSGDLGRPLCEFCGHRRSRTSAMAVQAARVDWRRRK